MADWLQFAIAATIVAGVFFSVWHHGRGNPESTGTLARQLRSHGARIDGLQEGLKGCATRGALDLLAEQVRNLEAHAASSGEVLALERKITGMNDTLGERIAAVKDTGEDTRAGVRRIEAILMKGALDK